MAKQPAHVHAVAPLSAQDTRQDPQWMPETTGSTKPYI